MKAIVFGGLMLLGSAAVWCQSLNQWEYGSAVLANDEVITGSLSDLSGYGMVLFRGTSDTLVLPAHRVKYFRYYDERANINRQFISLKQSGQYHFFEIVIRGPIMLLRSSRVHSIARPSDELLGYSYFVWDETTLTPAKQFSGDVYPSLQQQYPSIKDFVSSHHLKSYELKGVISIIREYNRIRSESSITARAD